LLALAASERFDQYSAPPSAANTAAAINKRANFMAVSYPYLRFHHTPTPAMIIASGSSTTLP